MGTAFLLDDIVLGAAILVAVLLFAPGALPWVVIGFVLWVVVKAYVFRAQFRKPEIGVEAMVGRVATALEDLAPSGNVDFDGELWSATSPSPVRKGERVRIEAVEGLTLKVVPVGVAGGKVWEPPKGSMLLALARRLRR